jgi:hypothetical protein
MDAIEIRLRQMSEHPKPPRIVPKAAQFDQPSACGRYRSRGAVWCPGLQLGDRGAGPWSEENIEDFMPRAAFQTCLTDMLHRSTKATALAISTHEVAHTGTYKGMIE